MILYIAPRIKLIVKTYVGVTSHLFCKFCSKVRIMFTIIVMFSHFISCIFEQVFDIHICDPSARNQSHVGRVRFPLRAEMHGRGHISDSCFIAFITSKIW